MKRKQRHKHQQTHQHFKENTRKLAQQINFITLFFNWLNKAQETNRKDKKPNSLTVNQRVLGSSPSSGATQNQALTKEFVSAFSFAVNKSENKVKTESD